MAARTIFINYRRDDSRADAGRLYDRLNDCYPGRIFRDVGSIGPGVEWQEAIAKVLGMADACIVVIGSNWLSATNSSGKKRLDDPRDTVRREILTALDSGIRVFPVLVGDAEMPAEQDLPEDIRPLTRRNALQISEQDWDEDFNKLVQAIEMLPGWDRKAPGPVSTVSTEPARPAERATASGKAIPQADVRQNIQPPAPATPPPARRSAGGVFVAAIVLLLIGGLGTVALRSGYIPWPGRQRPPAKTERAPNRTMPRPSADARPGQTPRETEGGPPGTSPSLEPVPSSDIPGNRPNPQAAGRESSTRSASRQQQTPSSNAPLPQNPPVFFQCAGAPEVCAALRSALDQALERESLPGVRNPARAEIVIGANVSVVDERVDRQFGTTLAVRTYSVELTGEVRRSGEPVPMPAPSSFSYDARFGRDRLAENAHLIAESAVEKARAFLKKR